MKAEITLSEDDIKLLRLLFTRARDSEDDIIAAISQDLWQRFEIAFAQRTKG